LAAEAAQPRYAEPPHTTAIALVSGDLTSEGHDAEFDVAIPYIEHVSPALAAGLAFGERHYRVPGNHDVWGGGLARGTVTGRASKARVLGFFPTPVGPRAVIDGDQFFDVGAVRVRVYSLDSTKEGWGNLFARGRVSIHDLQELKEAVDADEAVDHTAAGIETCLRVLVMHHPVLSINAPFIRLDDGTAVGDQLEAMKIGLILVGHEHDPDVCRFVLGDDYWQCIAGSASQRGRGNSFLVIDVIGEPTAIERGGTRVRLTVTRYETGDHRDSSAFVTTRVQPLSVVSHPV